MGEESVGHPLLANEHHKTNVPPWHFTQSLPFIHVLEPLTDFFTEWVTSEQIMEREREGGERGVEDKAESRDK